MPANAGFTQWLYTASPGSVSSWTESGDAGFTEHGHRHGILRTSSRLLICLRPCLRLEGSEAVDAEDDLVDCEDVVFVNFAFKRFAIVYLNEGDAIWIILCDRDL